MVQIILFCTPTLFFYIAVPGKTEGAVLGKAKRAEFLMHTFFYKLDLLILRDGLLNCAYFLIFLIMISVVSSSFLRQR